MDCSARQVNMQDRGGDLCIGQYRFRNSFHKNNPVQGIEERETSISGRSAALEKLKEKFWFQKINSN